MLSKHDNNGNKQFVLSFSWFVDFAQYEQWKNFAITTPKQAKYRIHNVAAIIMHC